MTNVIAPGTAWPPTAANLQLIMRNFFGGGPDGGYNASAADALASAALAVYPPSSIALLNIGVVSQVRAGGGELCECVAERDPAVAQFVNDEIFFCSTRRAVRAVVASGQPAYVYRFDYPIPSLEYDLFGDYHSAEVQYVFGNSVAAGSAMSASMMTYWTNFAKAGTPNGGGTPLAWPAYDAASDTILLLGTTTTTASDISTAACDFWDVSNAAANHPV